MSFVTRKIKVGEPFNEGKHVLAGREFVDGEFTFKGPTNEADSLALYFKNAYEATYTDEGVVNENEVEEDRTDTSGKSDVGGQGTVAKAGGDKGPVVGKPSVDPKAK